MRVAAALGVREHYSDAFCSCCASDVQQPTTVMARKYMAGTRTYYGGRAAVKPGAAAMPYADAERAGLVAGLCEATIQRSTTAKCVALLV